MDKIESLILRITERCNLKCAYCYAAGQPKPDMTPEMAVKAVELCCQPGEVLRVQFTGGEPLLNFPVMDAVYQYGKSTGRKLILAVQTNGTLLTPELCRWLKKTGCAVGVSLDGAGAGNGLRVFPDGSESFSHITQGIRCLGQEGLRCNVTTVISSANSGTLPQILDLSLVLGNIAGIGLDLFRPIGRGAEQDFSPEPEALEQGLKSLVSHYRELKQVGIPIHLRELDKLSQRRKHPMPEPVYCYAQTEKSLAVDGLGDCWPCSSLTGAEGCRLGNIRDGLPAKERSGLDLMPPAQCISCESFSVCKGGCPAMRSGRNHEPDSLTCQMHHILNREWEENR